MSDIWNGIGREQVSVVQGGGRGRDVCRSSPSVTLGSTSTEVGQELLVLSAGAAAGSAAASRRGTRRRARMTCQQSAGGPQRCWACPPVRRRLPPGWTIRAGRLAAPRCHHRRGTITPVDPLSSNRTVEGRCRRTRMHRSDGRLHRAPSHPPLVDVHAGRRAGRTFTCSAR